MLRTRLVAGVTAGLVLSTVFATALTVANYADAFFEPWRVDPSRPAPVTLRIPTTQIQTEGADGSLRFARVRATVRRGQMVKHEPLATLVRTYERSRRPPSPQTVGAQWLLYFVVFLLATAYMRRVSNKTAGLLRTQVGLLGLGMLLLLGGKAFLLFSPLPAATVPIALIALWTGLFVDRRTGLMAGIAMAICAASLVDYDVTTSAVYLMTSAVAGLLFRNRKQTSLLLVAGFAAGVTGLLTYMAARQLSGGFSADLELALAYRSEAFMSFAAPTGAGVLAFVMQPLVARMLGIVSRSRLLDLSDLDQPLLQKMQNEAPGSWEHSRMMANLAEAAASAIGGDTLLTRVGAYYHDLGKSVQPKYFVENLVAGEKSPHVDLDPHVSADAIMAHVVEGVRILRDGGIPEPVVEFAYTHHGTSVIEYFWHKHQEREDAKELTEDAFRYPGMRPRTRETGILMLIDAIEAGARTVDPPTREGFIELVRRVIFTKLQQGQLDDTGLSLQDLRICATRITDSLCSAYHSRIKYPWQEKKEAEERMAEERRVAAAAAAAEPRSDETPAEAPPGRKSVAAEEPPVRAAKKVERADETPRTAPDAEGSRESAERTIGADGARERSTDEGERPRRNGGGSQPGEPGPVSEERRRPPVEPRSEDDPPLAKDGS